MSSFDIDKENKFPFNLIEKGKQILKLQSEDNSSLTKYEVERMFLYLSTNYTLEEQNLIASDLIKKIVIERNKQEKELVNSLESLSNTVNTINFKIADEKEG